MPSLRWGTGCEESEVLIDEDSHEDYLTAGPKVEDIKFLRWKIVTAFSIAVATASLVLSMYRWPSGHETVFPTDLLDARNSIEYERRAYTGALIYNPAEQRIVRLRDAEREFFGPPGKDVDAAWAELLHDRFVEMTEEEAAPYRPELRNLPGTNHTYFELDMFHSLHCLNSIRKEISKNLYGSPMDRTKTAVSSTDFILPPAWDLAHLEHCMDRIRQALICHGDMTPSPLYFWDGFGIALGRTGERTCRKWEPIRRWLDERGRKSTTFDSV